MIHTSLLLVLLSLILFTAVIAVQDASADETPKPPQTRQEKVTETLHGVTITDSYRWLEDQERKETRDWIAAQNTYTDSQLDKLTFRKQIEERLTKLRRIDRYTTPAVRGERYFYSRRQADEEQYILYVREGLKGKERILFDPHPLSKDHTTSAYFSAYSKDGALAAVSVQEGGDDQAEIRFFDTVTGKELSERMPKAFYEGLSFTKDNKGFYYSRLTPLVGRRVYYHALGTDSKQDTEIFGKDTKAEDMIGASVSENGRWLLFHVWHGWAKNDLYVKDLANDGPIRPIVKDLDAIVTGDFAGDRLIAQTDWKAPNRRMVEIDLSNPSPEAWKTLVAEAADPIENSSLTGGRIFVQYLHNVNTLIKSFSPEGKDEGELALPGTGSASIPSGLWESKEAFYTFESFTMPDAIYRYDIAANKSAVWAKPKIPVKADAFETKQVWTTSKDGTKVPMFLVQKKGLKWDGARPTLIYAYGGFNSSMTPYFSPMATIWAENGGVFVVANLRGGGEFGEAWHRAGMLDKKQNVFDDLYGCAEWLISNKVTNSSKLAVSGGSNGGLLVGAAITQRPELFQAALCGVPLLDMVRYHQFLQGPQWVPEYGSSVDPEQFKTLYAYSPYHHVKSGTEYPAVMFSTGDLDTRVAPLHARKMTALLQAATASDRPILLHYETSTGHSGGEPLSKQIKDTGREMGFLFWQLGVTL